MKTTHTGLTPIASPEYPTTVNEQGSDAIPLGFDSAHAERLAIAGDGVGGARLVTVTGNKLQVLTALTEPE